MDIFLASKNKKKIEEIKAITDRFNLNLKSINDNIDIPEVVEDKDSFRGNSQKKALEIANYLNCYTIADDSGLCVDALNDAPGVYSARYAGEDSSDEDNNQKLLSELSGVADRKAKFVTVISVASPDGRVISFRGEVEGEILEKPQGENGFGYDPLFYYEGYKKSFAELSMEEKSKISHRGRASKKMAEKLNEFIK